MNKGDLTAQLRDFVELLEIHELADFISPIIEAASRLGNMHVNSVTSASFHGPSIGPLASSNTEDMDNFFAISNYITAFRTGDYVAVLKDGAILQVRYDFDRSKLVGHRLCFMPMPVQVTLDDFQNGETFADIVEFVVYEDPDKVRLRTPLRFDYCAFGPSSESPSHLHLIHDQGRVAVFGPLSLGHFVSIVFRTFYPVLWDTHEFLRDLRPKLIHKSINDLDEFSLHVACRH